MTQLNLSNDQLLSTTRAVRKRLDFDRPVEHDVLMECMELALQAPSGSNAQGWHFLFVTDEAKRQACPRILGVQRDGAPGQLGGGIKVRALRP